MLGSRGILKSLLAVVLTSSLTISLAAQDSLSLSEPSPFPDTLIDAVLMAKSAPASCTKIACRDTIRPLSNMIDQHDSPEHLAARQTAPDQSTSSATQEYCRRMSELLSRTLPADSSDESHQVLRQSAIEAAMLMVAETIDTRSRANIAELKAVHAVEISRLKTNSTRLSSGNSVEQFERRLAPIEANQTRNFQQMKTIVANHTVIARRLDRLGNPQDLPVQSTSFEQAAESPAPQRPHPINVGDPRFHAVSPDRANHHDNLANQLREEIRQLKHRLDKLQSETFLLQNGLKPVFTPDQPLRPVYSR